MSDPASPLDLSQFQAVVAAAIERRKTGSVRMLGGWRSELRNLRKGTGMREETRARLTAIEVGLDEADALLDLLVTQARLARAGRKMDDERS